MEHGFASPEHIGNKDELLVLKKRRWMEETGAKVGMNDRADFAPFAFTHNGTLSLIDMS